MEPEGERYSVGELAALGGVSRRTVRYYVQESLLPPPLGRGRGDHYGEEHLQRLLQVKAMQERGMSLDAIRERLGGRPVPPPPVPTAPRGPAPTETWTRLPVDIGVELHVAAGHPLPTPLQLQEIREAIRSILSGQPAPTWPVVVEPRRLERHEFEDPRPQRPPKPPAPEW
jgi:DNA-binding transcriptional MerR regulator